MAFVYIAIKPILKPCWLFLFVFSWPLSFFDKLKKFIALNWKNNHPFNKLWILRRLRLSLIDFQKKLCKYMIVSEYKIAFKLLIIFRTMQTHKWKDLIQIWRQKLQMIMPFLDQMLEMERLHSFEYKLFFEVFYLGAVRLILAYGMMIFYRHEISYKPKGEMLWV